MSLVVIILLSVFLLVLVWLVYRLVWGTPPWLNLAVERLTLRMVLSDPEILTTIGLADNTLLDFHSGRLTDASPRMMAARQKLDREGLALIRRYHPEKLSKQGRITYQLMRNLRGHRFDYHWIANPVFMGPYPVNPIFGVQVDLIHFLCNDHKIKGRRSARRYIQRLKKVPLKFTGLLESLQLREANGVIPPRFVIEKSLQQIENFLAAEPEATPLYTSFMERASETGRFGESALLRWGEQVQAAIIDDVTPAYQTLRVALEGLREKATEDDGVWRLPEGLDYYAFLLRYHTTTDLSADAIHQLGLAEVARLTAAVRSNLEALNLPAEDPIQQLRALMSDPQHHYSGENRRGTIIDDYQFILDETNQRMPEVFSQGVLDKIIVKRLPEFKEPDSPIAYAQAPSMNGRRPGTMWINLRDPDNVIRWGMRTLAYHEGIPGHVYQMAFSQKIRGLPTFRRTYFFNAYVEGWAMYAERLGALLNSEDPLSSLGRLQALLWRAARLVVDTGIHEKQWTREEAIAYMVEKTGLPERDVITEVERYIVMPGQACAYMIGYLKIIDLRQKAEATLGDAFDLKAFHDVILSSGSLPLTLLEKVVNDYIDRTAGLKLGDFA